MTNSLSMREKGPASALAVRVALYARVSTADQSYELQLLDLHDYAARQGWEITGVYQDVISGSKSGRPALTRLREDARARRFHCLFVWKLDRFGRSLVDCLNNVQILEDHDIASSP